MQLAPFSLIYDDFAVISDNLLTISNFDLHLAKFNPNCYLLNEEFIKKCTYGVDYDDKISQAYMKSVERFLDSLGLEIEEGKKFYHEFILKN